MKSLNDIMTQESIKRNEILKHIFAMHLKDLREEKRFSQKEMAEKLQCPVSTYANWEQGRREPSIYDIYNILWVLDIDAHELFAVCDE